MKKPKLTKEEEKVVGISIKNRWTDNIIFQSTKTIWKEAVEEAIEKNANLEYANLKYANLKYANLENANLENANLEDANLEYANTKYCTVNFSPAEYEQAKQFIEGLKRDK